MRPRRPASSDARRVLRETRGATMVEYSLLLFLILCVAFLAFQTLGKSTRQATDKATMAFMK